MDYEIRCLHVYLDKINKPELKKYVIDLQNAKKKRERIKEFKSITIDQMERKLYEEPKKYRKQREYLIDKVKFTNQQKIKQLQAALDKTKNLIEQHSWDEEQGRVTNNILLLENQKKQKLQEQLVQLLNETMAEKAKMQINVNKTILEMNNLQEMKTVKADEFRKYQMANKHEVATLISRTEKLVQDVNRTKQNINLMEKNNIRAYERQNLLNKQVSSLDQSNQTAKIQLNEHQRRLVDLVRQKQTSEKQIEEKRDVRNAKLIKENAKSNKLYAHIHDDYLKKIGIAQDNLANCRDGLAKAEVEKVNLQELKSEWEHTLLKKRAELDETVENMSNVRAVTEDFRIELDKKRRAVMRSRNELDGVLAELNRTLSMHKTETTSLRQLIEELETDVETSNKVKLNLEKQLAKINEEIATQKAQNNETMDKLETRNRSSVFIIKKNANALQETSRNLDAVQEKYDNLEDRYRKRRNAVAYDTKKNEDLIHDFEFKIVHARNEIEGALEDGGLKAELEKLQGPYSVLKKEHYDEDYKCNELKAILLALNLDLKNCQKEIDEDDKIIADMQEPRKLTKENLGSAREDLDSSCLVDKKAIDRIERQIYEIERKCQEYQVRNGEIYKKCQQAISNSSNMKKITNFIQVNKNKSSDTILNNNKKIDQMNEETDNAYQKISRCGSNYELLLQNYTRTMKEKYQNLVKFEKEIDVTCKGSLFG